MGEWSANNSVQRANQVWERLLGCFGESLIRKFGESPPQEWIAGIATLDEIKLARGMRRLVFSGKPHPPSLPEFLRLCRLVQDDDLDGQPSHQALPNPATGKFDRWDIAANQHLLGYITRRMSADPRCYGPVKSILPGEFPASPQQVTATEILVRHKHAWATDMREGRGVDPQTGEVIPYTVQEQQDSWADVMSQAEAAISMALAKVAA